jgi:pyruvate dehydrogenase E1 component alpha subunit
MVDGQEVETVHEVSAAAVKRARAGQGPTLIEAKTYRFDEHAVNLNISIPYRSKAEIEDYKTHRDPVTLYRKVLLDRGVTTEELYALEEEVAQAVQAAVTFAHESRDPILADVYRDMFSHPIHYPPCSPGERHHE